MKSFTMRFSGVARQSLRVACGIFILVIVSSLISNTVVYAINPPPVQTYYVPLPETEVRASLNKLYSGVGSPMVSIISFVVTGKDALVYYDHWEDGYELDIANPTQGTTLIFGDNNPANGNAATYCATCADDTFDSGDVVAFEDLVALPRNPSDVRFDGRDKIASTKNIAVSRASWSDSRGPVMAGAIEVAPVDKWGEEYKIPVGENVSADSMFEYTSLMVMATEDGTQVQIDSDGDTVVDVTQTLNQGENLHVDDNVNANATVTSNKPVQVHLITGDVGARYETRWFTMYPTDSWSDSSYSPVGTTTSSSPAHVFVYNPQSSQIKVYYETQAGTGDFNVAAQGVYRFAMPLNSGAHFYTADNSAFFAVSTIDSDADNSAYDWGFSLVPEASLTTEAVVGWGPGTADLSANGSPIWVTAAEATTVYVDFDADSSTGANTDPQGNRYDIAYVLNAFESRRIYDTTNNDNDQTGTRLYTLSGVLITAAWGQDPSKASPGNPYLDMGTTVLPLPAVSARKDVLLFAELIQNGFVESGETLLYTITVANDGTVMLPNVIVSDTLPTAVTYISNTMEYNFTPLADNPVPPSMTVFPLDEGGHNFGTLDPGDLFTLTFQVTVNQDITDVQAIQNQAEVDTVAGFLLSAVSVPVGGSTCVMTSTNAAGAPTTVYIEEAEICLRINDQDENTNPASLQTLTAEVVNLDNGDRETLILTETGIDTGIFEGCIQSSDTYGQGIEDSLLYAIAGDLITARYQDPDYASDVCEPPEPLQIAADTEAKFLYLTTPGQGLDRVDPLATHDSTDASVAVAGGGTETARDQFDSRAYNNSDGTQPWSNDWQEVRDTRDAVSPDPTGGEIQVSNEADGRLLLGWNDYDSGGGQTDQDTFPLVWRMADLSGASSAILTFDSESTANAASDIIVLEVSDDGGSSWTRLDTYSGPHAQQARSYDISAYIASNTAIRFWIIAYFGGSTDWFYADDIQIEYDAGAGPVVFTQTLPMAADFKMPTPPNVISVTVYADVTVGPMPGVPDIVATLKNGSTTFATLNNPVATLLSGSLYEIVWNGAAVVPVTVTAGSGITLEIASNESGLAFDLLYDSETYPSRFELPAASIINLDSLAVYDAAYPGGSAISAAFNGETVYVRGQVSDPFGYYDIITATLVISDPCSSAQSYVLTDTSAVNMVGAIKIYEQPWKIPSCTGAYTVTLTSFEGYEGLTDRGVILFNGDQDDTGTPSITEFIDSNGDPTGSYDPNDDIYIRVTDSDESGSGTITVTLTSPTGDVEIVTLTEIGSSGVFEASIPSNSGSDPGVGTLYAAPGDQIQVSYTDPDDPGDISGDDAIITTPAAAVSISKTLVDPSDGTAVLSDAIQFDILVGNPGPTTLTTVMVTDTFSTSCLTFQSASIPTDTSSPGTLVWNNVGPIASGDSQIISVYFEAAGACAPAANTVEASGEDEFTTPASDGPTSETVTINDPRVAVSKTKIWPAGGSATVGETVAFRISITNTGDSNIINLPVLDIYSAACLTFQSANPAEDGAGGGIIFWGNLGPLNASLSTSAVVTFTVAGPCSPAVNIIAVDEVRDENNDPVPYVEDSASITTLAEPPQVEVQKQLVSPASGTAAPGESITFTVQITNSGVNAITQIIISDTYGSDCMTLTSWNITPTQHSAGQALWNTLVPPYPPLLPGEAMSLTLTYSADAASLSCSNSITVAGADRYDQTFGPESSSDSVEIGYTVGSISGTVFEDLNGDGLYNPGEPGIGGVTIELVDPDTSAVISTTVTSGDGSYAFDDIIPGDYIVREIDPVGYTSTSSNEVSLTLGGGDALTVNFGDQKLGSVSGTVFEDLNGDGAQDPGEAGIGGVLISLLDPDTGAVISTTTTAGDGSYIFDNVVAGNYIVRETDPAGYTSTTLNTVPVSVGSGGAATANFGDQAEGTVSGSVFDDLNGNGAQDPGEPGLGGVLVELLDPVTSAVISSTTTAGDGSYIFTGVDPGAYIVQETDPAGYTSTTLNTVPVSIGSGGAATANFGDQTVGTVSGSVFEDLNGNGAQDPGEPGLGGVTIELIDPVTSAVISTTTTIADGSYIFTGVDPGAYIVRETDPGGFISTSSNDAPVSIGSGGAATANFGDQAQGTVSGSVFEDLDGDGIQGAGEPGLDSVHISLLDPDTGAVISSTTTITDGSFIFTNVDPGNYIVQESDPSGFTSTTSNSVPVSIGSGGAATASFGDQAEGTVSGSVFDDLDGDGVQDPGEPGLGAVVVSLIDPNTGAVVTTTTTGDGSYIFVGVEPGDYIVQETDPDGFTSTSSNSVPVSIGSGGAATANFGDQAEGSVSGTVFNDLDGDGVKDPGETGLGGVIVSLIDPDTGTTITTTTTGDGSYIFIGVDPGAYIVQETDPDGFISTSSNDVPISIGSGGAATANFGDQLTGTISGVVFNDWDGSGYQDAGEDGIGGVIVDLVDIDGNVIRTTTTFGDGTYIFTNVPADPYTVQEHDPGGFVSTSSNILPISLSPGGAATANFGDQLVGTVSGAVFNDLDGNGVQDAGEGGLGAVVVALLDLNNVVVMTTTTAGDGSYVFSGVEPGAYFVRETDPAGFASTTPNQASISVGLGGAETANFGDQAEGTVSGSVFADFNGNGVQDPGEPGLGGVVVELVDPATGAVITTTTSGDGSYIFIDVDPGDYVIQETDPDGFTSSTPNDVPVSLGSGEDATANFGDQPVGMVTGTVFNDHNGNGIQDPGEDGFGGVIVELIYDPGTIVVIITTTTTSDGSYIFTGVLPGDYTVRETDPEGFVSSTPNDVPITVAPGGAAAANFGDQLTGTVSGIVFNDLNSNGIQDPGEEGIGGVTVELLNDLGSAIITATTAGDGSYIFTVVPPGDYTVQETDPGDFISTTDNLVPVSMVSGGAATANFGDRIVLKCMSADDYEYDNLYTQAAPISTTGAPLTRNFHVVSDKDWVQFFIGAGRTYTVSTSHLDDDTDTVLQLYDLDGANLLDENDDYEAGSRASRIVRTATESGQYFARITHFDRTYDPNSSGLCGNGYQVQVHLAPCDVQADSHEPDSFYTQAARIRTDGAVVTRTFEAVSDKDWLRFEAQAGRTYTINTLNLGAATDTILQLYARDGVSLLDENDDYQLGSEASRIIWSAPESGEYFVRVAHFDHTYDPRTAPLCGNGYQVKIETPLCAVRDAYEADDHYDAAVFLPPGGEALTRGFDSVSDKDWFKFYSRADSNFSVATFNLDDNVDTILQLYDADGVTLLWENDDYEKDNKASRIEWTATRDGWYFVRATHFDHVYDPRYDLVCGNRYDIVLTQDSLKVVKTVRDSDKEFRIGSIIEYDIVIWNKLNTIQPNVVMTDYIPLNTVYISNTARTTKGRITGPDPLVVHAGTLQANQRITVTFQVQIVSDSGGPIVNYAITKSDYQRLIAQTPTVATRIVSYTYLPIMIKQYDVYASP